MEQIIIALTGSIAIWLTQQDNKEWARYACIFGLVGQPFWFISSYNSEQWGIFALCFLYTYSWCIGLYRHWIKRWIRERQRPRGKRL